MTTSVAYAHTHTDQEQVAELALAQSIKAVPVIDDNKEFVGVISSDKILQILNEEHLDDFYKSAGLHLDANDIYHSLSWFKRIASRMPWLLLGLLGGVSTAYIIKLFESTIATQLIIASFIPAVVCLSDAVGNQSEMIYIRTLGSNRKSLWSYLGKELLVASAIGIILAGMIFVISYIWIGNPELSIILGISILATVYFSVFVAVFLPWMFERLGFDPAVTSGPLATVIYDISSIVIYLTIASTIL
jgi:magnesium transporter